MSSVDLHHSKIRRVFMATNLICITMCRRQTTITACMRSFDFLNFIFLFYFSIRETNTASKFKGNYRTTTLHCNNVGETKIWKWFTDSKLLSRVQKSRLQKLYQSGRLALFRDRNVYGGLRTSHWIHNQIVKHQQIWDIRWCTLDAKHTKRYWNFALFVL